MVDVFVLDKVRDVPLQSFISKFVKLKRSGSSLIGLCPFHDEKTPSFSVHPTKGYTCFGCGASGSNAIDFMMAYEKTSFADAVKRVAGLSSIFIEHNADHGQQRPLPKKQKAAPPFNPTIIPDVSVKRFEINYTRSFLFSFLAGRYGTATVDKLFRTYGVGACTLHRDFAEGNTTLFIQRDIYGRIRQMNAMLYNPENGKWRRDKKTIVDKETGEKKMVYQYAPKKIGQPHMKRLSVPEEDIYLVQCFFGESLLKSNTKPVAIVESEKTAMIASLHYPQFVWLATGGSFGIGKPMLETWGVLKGRKVHMYPDADKLFQWIDLAAEYEDLFGEEIIVHDIMAGEPIPEGYEKWDFADILLAADEPQQPGILNIDAPLHFDNVIRFFFSEPEFKGIELSTIQVSDGKLYDCLINVNGDFFSDPQVSTVKAIAAAYSKNFQPGIFYGFPCLLHLLN